MPASRPRVRGAAVALLLATSCSSGGGPTERAFVDVDPASVPGAVPGLYVYISGATGKPDPVQYLSVVNASEDGREQIFRFSLLDDSYLDQRVVWREDGMHVTGLTVRGGEQRPEADFSCEFPEPVLELPLPFREGESWRASFDCRTDRVREANFTTQARTTLLIDDVEEPVWPVQRSGIGEQGQARSRLMFWSEEWKVPARVEESTPIGSSRIRIQLLHLRPYELEGETSGE